MARKNKWDWLNDVPAVDGDDDSLSFGSEDDATVGYFGCSDEILINDMVREYGEMSRLDEEEH